MTNQITSQENVNLDIKNEQLFLRALTVEPDLLYDCILEPSDFSQPYHQEIFKITQEIYRTERNSSSVLVAIEDAEMRNYYERSILNDLHNSEFNRSQEKIKESAIKREVLGFCEHIKQSSEALDSSSLMGLMQDGLNGLITKDIKEDTINSATACYKAMEDLEDFLDGKKQLGVKSYLADMDNVIGAFGNGQLITIGAPSSHGKTALALSMALNQARQGYKVGFFSLEMSSDEIAKRLASMNTHFMGNNVSYDKIIKNNATSNEIDLFRSSIADVGNLDIYYNDFTNIDVHQISRVSSKWKSIYGVDIIYIDYIQLVGGKKDAQSREREVASITKALKNLAKQIDIPIIIMSQVNREINGGAKVLRSSHLRESSAIEHDSDKVMMMWRPYMLEGDSAVTPSHHTELLIDKNRQGKRGGIKLYYKSDLTLFLNKSHSYQNEENPF